VGCAGCIIHSFARNSAKLPRVRESTLIVLGGLPPCLQVLSAVPLPNPSELQHGTWAEKKAAIPEKLGKSVFGDGPLEASVQTEMIKKTCF